MLLLILEIILIVAAWRRGWKGWALVPIIVTFLMGVAIGASGGDVSLEALVLLEIVCGVVPLIVMVSRPRKVIHGVKKTSETLDESPQYSPTTTTQAAHPVSASSDAVSSSMIRIDK